jgi:hypothetical protein
MRAVEAEQGSLGCKRKLDGWALKQGNSFVSAHRGSFLLKMPVTTQPEQSVGE